MINIQKIVALLFVCVLLLSACKKDKDIVSSQTIHGQVYNQCTDSGMANITVYLQENGSNITQMASDANGNFTFSNVQIHSSNDYTYNLYIPSKSGIGNGSEVGFGGGNYNMDKSKLTSLFILGVIPQIKHWYLYLPKNASITDTFTLILQQNIYHKNFPTGNYKINTGAPPPPQNGYIGDVGDYWMGWWKVTTDKIKNGIHTIKIDSIYIGYGATVTDTIPW